MNITTDFMILSRFTIVDSNSGALSLMNLVEGVNLDNLPQQLDDFRITCRFTVTDSDASDEFEVEFKLLNPDGKESPLVVTNDGSNVTTVSYAPNEKYQKTGLILDGVIQVDMPGRHMIKAYTKGSVIASQDIAVFSE